MLYQQSYPTTMAEEKIITTLITGEQYRNSAKKLQTYEERQSEQKRRDESKYDIQYYRDLCEQLNKENLQLKSFQIENNQLKQRQLLIDAELQSVQQEVQRLRNQNGLNLQTDKQVLKLSQDNQLLQQQNNELSKLRQTLETELRIYKESRLTQTIEIPDMNVSQYQRKIKEMEEDIQVLIDDYNNSQQKLEKALQDQKMQMRSEIDQLKNENMLLQSELTGWQQRYSKIEVTKNELVTKLSSFESKMQQVMQQNNDYNLQEKQQSQTQAINQLKEQFESSQRNISNLKNQLSQSESKRNDLKSELKKMKSVIEQQKQELEKISQSKEKSTYQKTNYLQQQIDQYKQQIQEKDDLYQEELQIIKSENESARNDLHTQIANLKEELKIQENNLQAKLQNQEITFQDQLQTQIQQQALSLQINKPLNYEESRIKFQTQLDVNNFETQVDKLKKEVRLQEQFIKEQAIQAKLWQEKFYDQQTQNEDLRYKYQELRNQFSTYLGYKTQNEYDQNKINELEMLVEEQQNLLHNLYQKEIHYKDTIQVYLSKIEEIQYRDNDENQAKIQQLLFEIDQQSIKHKEMETQYKSLQTEYFQLQTQIEFERHRITEKDMQIDKQLGLQNINVKKIQQLEQQVENLQREYNLICQKKNEVIKEFIQVDNEYDKERISQLEQSLQNLQQEYLIVNGQYSTLQNQFTQLTVKIEQQTDNENKGKIRTLEDQLSSLKQQYHELNILKQQVVKEVVEIPSQSDQLQIKQLKMDLQILQEENAILQQQKQQIVQVPSDIDKNRVKELEQQLIKLRKDYDEISKSGLIQENQIIEVSSKQDQIKIKNLEKLLGQLQADYFQLSLKQDVKNSQMSISELNKISELQQQIKFLKDENSQLLFNKEQNIKNSTSSDKLKIQQLEQQIKFLEENNQQIKIQSQRVIQETISVSKDEDIFKISQLELQLKIKIDDNQYLDKQLQLQKKNVEELINANEKMKQENTAIRQQIYQLQMAVDESSYKIRDFNRLQEEVKQNQININQLDQKEKLLIESQSTISNLRLQISDFECQVRKLQSEQSLIKQDHEFKIKTLELKSQSQIQLNQQELQQKQSQSDQEKSILKNTLKQITLQNEEMQKEIARLSEMITMRHEQSKEMNNTIAKYKNEQVTLKQQLELEQKKQQDVSKQFSNYQTLQQQTGNLQDHCNRLEIALKQFEQDKRTENKALHEQFNSKIMEFQEIIYTKDSEIQSLQDHINGLLEKINQHGDIECQFEDNKGLMIDLQNQINAIRVELKRQVNLKEELQSRNDEYIFQISQQEQEIHRLKGDQERLSFRTLETGKFDKGLGSQRTVLVADFNLADSHISNMQRASQMRTRDSTSLYNNPKQNNFNPLSSSVKNNFSFQIVKQKVFTQQKNQIY